MALRSPVMVALPDRV